MHVLNAEETTRRLHLNVKRVQGLAREGKLPVITRSSAERLRPSVDDEVFAVIKCTEVMIGTKGDEE